MESAFSDAVVVLTLFLSAIYFSGYVCETYAPKLLDWIEKQVSR